MALLNDIHHAKATAARFVALAQSIPCSPSAPPKRQRAGSCLGRMGAEVGGNQAYPVFPRSELRRMPFCPTSPPRSSAHDVSSRNTSPAYSRNLTYRRDLEFMFTLAWHASAIAVTGWFERQNGYPLHHGTAVCMRLGIGMIAGIPPHSKQSKPKRSTGIAHEHADQIAPGPRADSLLWTFRRYETGVASRSPSSTSLS